MRDVPTEVKTVGILYPGEMGASLGKLLSEAGFQVVTALEGRSPRTRRLCLEAGLQPLNSISDVAQSSDVVISLVPPAAALDLAKHYCSLARLCPRRQIYVDANSISPATAAEISSLLSGCGIRFVDASIHGLASRLRQQGTLYLSGYAAPPVAQLFAGLLKVKLLGDAAGKASAFKMLMGGMSKGLVALFLEMSLAARHMDALDDLLSGYEEYYPGVMEAIERMLPTYPRHAVRRGDEMRELEQAIKSLGLDPNMASAARRVITDVGALELAKREPQKDKQGWSVRDVIEAVYLHGLVETNRS